MFGGELRGDDEFDETLSDIWPKRTVKEVDIVPKVWEASDGYWMTGEYVSIEALTGALTFEISLTLHTPRQNDNWIYMQWF